MKIFLAGYETIHKVFKTQPHPLVNYFLTFYYEKYTTETLRDLKPKGHLGTIVIDSGAHSFFEIMGISVTGVEKNKKKDIKSPYEYFEKYLDWIKKNYDFFDYFVELDLQEIVGQDQLMNWRLRLKRDGLYDKCIPVHHSYNTNEQWKELVAMAPSQFIAIEGLRPGQPVLPYENFIKYAYDRQVRVHGFAFTKSKLLHQYPFYSVDSSTWTGCTRWGALNKFINGQLKNVKTQKKSYQNYIIPLSSHSLVRGAENSKRKLEETYVEFLKMELYFTEYWNKKGVVWSR